ncbi:hypothetical protein ACRAWD_18105 [Caulobacter segnis]
MMRSAYLQNRADAMVRHARTSGVQVLPDLRRRPDRTVIAYRHPWLVVLGARPDVPAATPTRSAVVQRPNNQQDEGAREGPHHDPQPAEAVASPADQDPSLMRMLVPLVLFAVTTTLLFAMVQGDDPDDRADGPKAAAAEPDRWGASRPAAGDPRSARPDDGVGSMSPCTWGCGRCGACPTWPATSPRPQSRRGCPSKAAPREVAPLVEAFNAALDRLEVGLRCAAADFSANAAHELQHAAGDPASSRSRGLLEPSERRAASEGVRTLGPADRPAAGLGRGGGRRGGRQRPLRPGGLVARRGQRHGRLHPVQRAHHRLRRLCRRC